MRINAHQFPEINIKPILELKRLLLYYSPGKINIKETDELILDNSIFENCTSLM